MNLDYYKPRHEDADESDRLDWSGVWDELTADEVCGYCGKGIDRSGHAWVSPVGGGPTTEVCGVGPNQRHLPVYEVEIDDPPDVPAWRYR